MVFRMDFGAEEAENVVLLATKGPLFLGDIFCLDLGLGCVINEAVDVVGLEVMLVVVLVAGNRVGGAREICVLPDGGWVV